MGCTSSSKKPDEDYYNKDIDEKRKLLTGFHMSCGPDGIETNFQVAISRKLTLELWMGLYTWLQCNLGRNCFLLIANMEKYIENF